MTHTLIRGDKHRPWNVPLIATLRYRCECANGEVITISVVLDMDMQDDQFAYVMKQMKHDMAIEIQQHIKGAK